jgi:8-oxo-dGTP diphosphatase
MQSYINHNVVEQLVITAHKDCVQKLVVGAVIRRDGKYLLLERTPSDFMGGLVELPSGTVNAAEDLLTALAREVYEETGLMIASILIYLGSFDYTSSSGKKTRQFNFLVETFPGNIQLQPVEHNKYYLVAPSDGVFNTLNISEATKMVLNAVE